VTLQPTADPGDDTGIAAVVRERAVAFWDFMEYVFRKPTGSPAEHGAAPPRYRREDGPPGMIIERDVPVPVRGGITVYADVFRPADQRPAPPLIAWSPYGKHAGPQLPERYPDGGAWGGAHGFRKVRGPLRAAGHEVFTPSLTGIGERAHLTSPQVGLTTHITDVVNTVEYEDLRDMPT
jgi:hypothetical protein